MEPTPPEADLDDLATLTAQVTREHLIVLCCGQSVVELVDEVARNLRGLGFAVEVVCGAEARTALLGRSSSGNEPTIYVVCVQGTLKEQVLKPLRQALATHGGPNQHLFVAVLDLSLPLAMVGQIRRFAEALERPRRRGSEAPQERRQWREQLGPNSERVATRSYRALEVVGRAETGPTPAVDAVRRTGPQAVIGSGRPARVGVTAKYRAITGSLPAAVTSEAPTERRRRRAHAPKVRVKPVAEARAAAPPSPAPAVEARPATTGDTVVATPRVAIEVTSSATTTQIPPAAPRIVATPAVDVEAPIVARERSTLPYVLGGIGVVAAIAAGLWFGGVLGPKTDDAAAPTKAAVAAKANAEPKVAKDPPPPATERPTAPPEPAAPPPAEIAAPPATPPAEPTPPPAEPTPPPAEPAPKVEPAPPVAATPTPPAAEIDPAFADAVASRRLRLTDHLYVTAFQVTTGSWQAARKACDDLEIGGKGGFRLPHRRELQGIEAAGWLEREPHWSRTVPDDDKESAYVIHPSTGQLTVWFKEEDAAAICVRAR